MKNVLLVKYGEIAVRGKNRYLIENRLIDIIKKNIEKYGQYSVTKEQGRLLIENYSDDFDYDRIIPSVINIMGVVAVCPCVKTENQNIENLREISINHMKKYFSEKFTTFKVETKRSDKRYPMQSREISADIGGHILHSLDNVKVNVHNPDVTLMVELRNNAYIYSKLIKGFGGLPIGASGKATLLMSGGIDSPVAGFMIAKRGVEIDAVYFNSPPYTSERAKQKVIDLAQRLSLFTGKIKLYIVPFTDIQLQIYNNTPPEKMTILLKRAMFTVAEKIAEKNGSMALITGDSIGQVASQTMHSINAIDSAVKNMPVLRPLAGFDKQEIVDIAKKIETFEISIRPYEDCCTIFVAKHPETKPKKSIIEKIEFKIPELNKLICKAIEETEIIEV